MFHNVLTVEHTQKMKRYSAAPYMTKLVVNSAIVISLLFLGLSQIIYSQINPTSTRVTEAFILICTSGKVWALSFETLYLILNQTISVTSIVSDIFLLLLGDILPAGCHLQQQILQAVCDEENSGKFSFCVVKADQGKREADYNGRKQRRSKKQT